MSTEDRGEYCDLPTPIMDLPHHIQAADYNSIITQLIDANLAAINRRYFFIFSRAQIALTDSNTERPWQPKVVKNILDLVKSGTKRIILNAPTGSGKTKIALELIRTVYRESGLDSYVTVRTMNEMIPYDETVAKFQKGLIYRYMIGKRRGCAYYTDGDDANTSLCDACLGREIVIEKYTDEWGGRKKEEGQTNSRRKCAESNPSRRGFQGCSKRSFLP